jgi:hypothetical protein
MRTFVWCVRRARNEGAGCKGGTFVGTSTYRGIETECYWGLSNQCTVTVIQ